ncbi:MAG: alpha/beta hydrolase family esterase [Ktedonobacteraceae bacterium]
MHNPNKQSAHAIRRFIAIIGLGTALIIILGVIVFSANGGIISGIRQPSANSSKSAINLIPIHNMCQTPLHKTGDETLSIRSSGLTRTFIVHLAPSYGTLPQALVFNYHGYQNTALRTAQRTDMSAEADKAGFILVFPQGVDNPPSWNAGIGAYGPTGDANDVQFTSDLISYFEHNYCVDTHRIYVTGYSLGGGMVYRIACTLSDQIAAFATVAGAFYRIPGGCNPSRPIPLLEIHGQADQFAPYDGNMYVGMASVQTYLNFWIAHDQCRPDSKVIFQKADVTALEWSQCAKGTVIQHYRISDGGHVWPGSNPTLGIGYNSHTIDASVVIWNFFSQFSS